MSTVYLRRELGGGASLETLRALVGLPRPVSARALLAAYAEPVMLGEPLVTADGVALGGHHSVVLHRDGRYRYEGHFRATGWPSYRVSIATLVRGTEGAVLALADHGEVYGTNEAGDREYTWVQEGTNDLIAANWPSFRHATIGHNLQYDVDIFGTAGDVLAFLAQAFSGYLIAGHAGLFIFAGSKGLSALNLEELSLPGTVGIAVAGGTLFVFGPSALVPALVAGAAAGAVVAALVRQRRLTDEEFDFAARVFGGTLDRDRILLTNLIGMQGRAFTTPGPGGAILLNLGDGYQDPLGYTGYGGGPIGVRAAGQLLVHELVHAWQIMHTRFLPGLMCRAIAGQVGTLGGDMSSYRYGPPGQNWDSIGLESQGSIVDEWFAGKNMPAKKEGVPPPPQLGFEPMEPSDHNPYFKYIRDNIRAGVA